MKKVIVILLSVCLLSGMLSACGRDTRTAGSGKISVVATIFPIYDWLREIIGNNTDGVELSMLLDNGVDLHSYQPNAKDLVRVSSCDLFVYVGGTSDQWVRDMLTSVQSDETVIVNLLDAAGERAKEEELVEGMQPEAQEEEEAEYDEHVWLSLKTASALCGTLAEKLGETDPQNADVYRQNAQTYTTKLNALDGQYRAVVDSAAVKTLLFADRFPFRYMADDYGLSYFAAFAGCSAETEASFKTILFLAGKTDKLNLHSILQIESADGSVARTVRENTKTKDQTILTMNSMQSLTSQDINGGVTYLSVMTENLETLRQALQG